MTSQPLQSPAPEYALLALLAAFWGSSYLLIKLALATIPPVTLIAIRVTIASLFLLAIMRLRSERLQGDGGQSHYQALQAMVELLREHASNRRTKAAQALLDDPEMAEMARFFLRHRVPFRRRGPAGGVPG